MLTQVIKISLVGIGVVFSFLTLIFLLLKGLKFFATSQKQKSEVSSNGKASEQVDKEVAVAIMAALNEAELLDGEEIVIRKK